MPGHPASEPRRPHGAHAGLRWSAVYNNIFSGVPKDYQQGQIAVTDYWALEEGQSGLLYCYSGDGVAESSVGVASMTAILVNIANGDGDGGSHAEINLRAEIKPNLQRNNTH